MFMRVALVALSFVALAKGAPRIIGGHDAPNHKYPYQISFRDDERGHFCSGSILNQRWILSAGHCFEGRNMTFKISAGTNFLNETGDVYMPEFYIIHENYVNFYYFDIAMVRLTSDIVFTDFVKPIRMPEKDLKESKSAAFAGWGSIKLWGPAPNALQELPLQTLTFEQCKQGQNLTVEAHICTLNKADEGICHGDSGGPLVVDGEQVGIASYVNPCALNFPDVFTRVWSYKDWIIDNLLQYEDWE